MSAPVQLENLIKVGKYVITGAAVLFIAKKAVDAYRSLVYYPFPGPRGGIFGVSLSQVSPKTMEKIFAEHTDVNNSPVSLRVKGTLIVVLGDLEDIRTNLKPRPEKLRRTKLYNVVFDAKPGSPGLFTADGEEWKRQHRVYAPALNSVNVNQMLPLVCEKTAVLMQQFEKLGTVTELVAFLKLCTVDIICEAALGIKFHYIERAEQLVKGEADPLDERVQLRTLLELRFTDSARQLLRNPLLALIASRCPRWLASRWDVIRTIYERGEACCAITDKLIRTKYDQIRADPAQAKPTCLYDQALLQMLGGGEERWTEAETLAVLNSNFATLFVAGSDTTAHTAAWLWYFLCVHPHWQARCRTQLRELLGGRGWWAVGAGEVKQLTAVRACLLESIRLSPTTPMHGNLVKAHDFHIRGRHVPAGTVIMYLARHCTTAGSGLEAPLEFRPERWLDGAGQLRSEHEVGSGVLAFGAGPRMCPGRQLAETEVTVMTAAGLATFSEWSMLQHRDEVKRQDLTTVAPGPLGIRFSGHAFPTTK